LEVDVLLPERETTHSELFLLKMNIEGAEYAVLESLLRDGIFPRIIALTFEGSWALLRAASWTRTLKSRGYSVCGVYGWAVTFLLETAAGENATGF
jgi:hypothetical protein